MSHLFLKRRENLCEINRPVSALLTVSEMFEGFMQKQLTNYISNLLLPQLCGYGKGLSS